MLFDEPSAKEGVAGEVWIEKVENWLRMVQSVPRHAGQPVRGQRPDVSYGRAHVGSSRHLSYCETFFLCFDRLDGSEKVFAQPSSPHGNRRFSLIKAQ